MTQNERINQMSIIQKAEFLKGFKCANCPIDYVCNLLREEDVPENIAQNGRCFSAWYKYLGSEVSESES